MESHSRRPSRHAHSRSPRHGGGGFTRSRRKPHNAHGGDRNRGGFTRSHGQSRGQSRRGKRALPTFDPTQFINRTPVETAPEIFTPRHTFESFGLDERIVRTARSLGVTTPTPIQDAIIPLILEGHDVVGLAETGTGKTAAFLAPLIHKTLAARMRLTLILAPTRELALQIDAELKRLGAGLGLHSATCVGGMNIGPQIRALRNRNQFIIGTPGRILDLIERKFLPIERVTTVILDEADRMLDMGFITDIRSILSRTPKDRETLFFSATMPKSAELLVSDFLRNPTTVSVKKRDVTKSVAQDVVPYSHHSKFETLLTLLKDPACTRVIIFGAMKHSVEKLSKELTTHGVRADSIHGNKNHNQRQRALQEFKQGRVRVLVATDVAARGIHVDNVSHVINYDLPGTFEDYVHRIGRTGRGAHSGIALTFVETHAPHTERRAR